MRPLALLLAALIGGSSRRSFGRRRPPGQPEAGLGPVTKLPVPRYVSLKTDRVNLREGPSKDHRTLWVFQRAGLPVEIMAEFETWRRIRDSEGTEGWVLHSLLSGRRTALVMPRARAATGGSRSRSMRAPTSRSERGSPSSSRASSPA